MYSMDDFTFGRQMICQGQAKCAFLWEPDTSLSMVSTEDSPCDTAKRNHRVFSTHDADRLVADNLLTTTDFLAARPDVVEKVLRIFFKGAEIGKADLPAAAKLISTVEPRFRDELKYQGTLESLKWVKLTTLADNISYFGLNGPAGFDAVYKQADTIWSEYTETDGTPVLTKRYSPATLRDGSIVRAIYQDELAKKAAGEASVPLVVEAPKYNQKAIAKAAPVLKKSVSINFGTNESVVQPTVDNISSMKETLKTANLNTMAFRVEGNTDDVGDPKLNKILSLKRAAAVRAALILQGVPAERIGQPVGHGQDNPICTEKTDECRAMNRRTDIVFVNMNR